MLCESRLVWRNFCSELQVSILSRISIIPIFRPFGGVRFDVFPDLAIIVFISDHMLVVGFLPQGCTGLSGGPAFHLPYDCADRRGGYHPPALNGMNLKDQMNVVWHDDVMINGNAGIDG